jgi:CrcB protein
VASPLAIRILLLAVAGAAGTIARYGAQVAVHRGGGHPAIATGAVNLAGCLAFGLVLGALETRPGEHAELRVVVLTGFLGAFTTFSALIGDSTALARADDAALGLANVGVQLVAGALLLTGGIAAGRVL